MYCPESFDVQLQQNEPHRIVHWKEPQFRSHRPLKQIFKTRKPGEILAAGVHRISYIATDVDGLSSKCDFTVSVKGNNKNHGIRHSSILIAVENLEFLGLAGRVAPSAPIRRINRLENHESYLMCPDRPAMKLDTSFPVSRVRVFYRTINQDARNARSRNHAKTPRTPKHFIDIYHWNYI